MGHQVTGGDAGSQGGVCPEGVDGDLRVGGLGKSGAAEEGVDYIINVGLELLGGAVALAQREEVAIFI